MRILKFRLPLLVVAVGVVVFILLSITEDDLEPLQPKSRAPTVSVQVVTKTTASPTLRIFGEVESPSMSVLTAGVEADVLEVLVLEGNAVARGEEMLVLDDADAALEVLQRQAQLSEIEALLESDRIKQQADKAALETEQSMLALSRKAVDRAERLARSKVGTEAALDQALQDAQRQQLSVTQRQRSVDDFASRRRQLQARRDNAAAALKRAERDRRRTRVTAPFDGRIAEVMVSPGERATRDRRLLRLYDETALELRAQVPGGYIPTLRRALDAGREVNAVAVDNSLSIELILHRLSASVAEGQGGIDAFFRARDGRLPAPGGTLEVRLQLPLLENVVLLSPNSLYGRDRVYQVRDSVLQSKPVRRLGQLNDEQGRQMLIIAGDGFEDGEQILNSRLPQAVSGLEVRVLR